jgi:antitoxin MazE
MQVQVERWGGSLAIRLPASLVHQLGLQEGDQIDLVTEDGHSSMNCLPPAGEVLSGLACCRFRGHWVRFA